MNKLRAYELQDGGMDTVEANESLGFAADARDYEFPAKILKKRGATRIRLLSNNPDKIRQLESAGIRVVERVPCQPRLSKISRAYLQTKSIRWGTCSRAVRALHYLRTGGAGTPVIQQTVRFRTTPRTLFAMYRDSKKHSKSTGMSARMSGKVGGRFRAFKGMLEGKNLLIVPGRQIVQLWRATHWKKEDWSILILTFSRIAAGAQIDLVHVECRLNDHEGVREGWPKYYWKGLKKYLAK